MYSSQKRYIRKYLFGAPSSRSIRRPNGNLGTYWHLRNCFSYSDVMCSRSSIIFEKEWTPQTRRWIRAAHRFRTKPIELWVLVAIGCVMRKTFRERHTHWERSLFYRGYIMRHTLWVFPETTTTATLVSVSERLEYCFCSVTKYIYFCL